MENEFEKYLQQNKDRFETGSPSPRVWKKLQRDLVEHPGRRNRVIRMRRIGWSVAATILLCIGVTIALLKTGNNGSGNNLSNHTAAKDSPAMQLAGRGGKDSINRVAGVTDTEARESLYHYSRLIESRQKQMAMLQQINPDLYARSQQVLADLNLVYTRLQKQLPGSPDQQKVLEALIQNLKMQEQVLNNQLQLLEELQNDTTDGKKVKKI